MTSTRIGFAEDFSLKNQLVGIGTNQQEVKLRVVGTIKGDFNVKDETTLSVYSGFIVQNYNINVPSVLSYTSDNVGTFTRVNERETDYLKLEGEYNTLSEDIIVDEDRIFEVSDDSLVSVGTLESVSIQSHFSVPDGGTNERPDQPVEGMVRFNDDLNTLEFYNGIEWRQFTFSGASGRAYLAGGARRNNVGGSYAQIESFSLISGGTVTDFGQLENGNGYFSGCASSVRGIFAGGSPYISNLQYITLSTKGTSVDYGQMYVHRASYQGTLSSSTRGIVPGGYLAPVYRTEIDYFEIATKGGAQDFGDLYSAGMIGMGGMASPTRGVYAGGYIAPTSPLSPATTEIGYLTISSKGNSLKFGDSSNKHAYAFAGSNQTRGIFGGGTGIFPAQIVIKTLETVEIASTGNSFDFGDLTVQRRLGAASSSNTRIVCFGGTKTVPGSNNDSSDVDTIKFSSLGNAVDFGDISQTNIGFAECSDSHGGLGGF